MQRLVRLPYACEDEGFLETIASLFGKFEAGKVEELQRRGIFWLGGEIDESNTRIVINNLLWGADKALKPLHLFISTHGGSVASALSVYDTIQLLNSLGVPVNTVAVGSCYSAGVIILQAGATRLITPNTYLLIHEISSWSWGKVSEHEDYAKHLKEFQERVFKILASRSKISAATLKRKVWRKDWWLSVEEALKMGFVDAKWQGLPLSLPPSEQVLEK